MKKQFLIQASPKMLDGGGNSDILAREKLMEFSNLKEDEELRHQ